MPCQKPLEPAENTFKGPHAFLLPLTTECGEHYMPLILCVCGLPGVMEVV